METEPIPEELFTERECFYTECLYQGCDWRTDFLDSLEEAQAEGLEHEMVMADTLFEDHHTGIRKCKLLVEADIYGA